jgi:hypothetical protein
VGCRLTPRVSITRHPRRPRGVSKPRRNKKAYRIPPGWSRMARTSPRSPFPTSLSFRTPAGCGRIRFAASSTTSVLGTILAGPCDVFTRKTLIDPRHNRRIFITKWGKAYKAMNLSREVGYALTRRPPQRRRWESNRGTDAQRWPLLSYQPKGTKQARRRS